MNGRTPSGSSGLNNKYLLEFLWNLYPYIFRTSRIPFLSDRPIFSDLRVSPPPFLPTPWVCWGRPEPLGLEKKPARELLLNGLYEYVGEHHGFPS